MRYLVVVASKQQARSDALSCPGATVLASTIRLLSATHHVLLCTLLLPAGSEEVKCRFLSFSSSTRLPCPLRRQPSIAVFRLPHPRNHPTPPARPGFPQPRPRRLLQHHRGALGRRRHRIMPPRHYHDRGWCWLLGLGEKSLSYRAGWAQPVTDACTRRRRAPASARCRPPRRSWTVAAPCRAWSPRRTSSSDPAPPGQAACSSASSPAAASIDGSPAPLHRRRGTATRLINAALPGTILLIISCSPQGIIIRTVLKVRSTAMVSMHARPVPVRSLSQDGCDVLIPRVLHDQRTKVNSGAADS